MENYISKLGCEAIEKVTGMKGIITSISFDLYGCIQASLTLPAEKGQNEVKMSGWLDWNRLTIGKKKHDIMTFSTYHSEEKGPAEKPMP